MKLAHEHFFHFVKRPKEGRAKYYYDLKHVEPRATDVAEFTGKDHTPAWIYLFDIDAASRVSPNPIVIRKVIATDAESLSHYALKVAPEAAVAGVGATDRVVTSIRRRLKAWWPDLGTAPIDISGKKKP